MKRLSLPIICLLLLACFFSCKKKDKAPDNSGSVMFVNGCAGTLPGVDAQADEVNISGALNIPFTSFSGYKYVKAGAPVKLAWFITNTGTPLANKTVTLVDGVSYSAFAAGLVTGPSFVFVQDDLASPAPDKAKVRIVNLSPDAMKVTGNANNTVIDTAVTSLMVSPFVQVTAGVYNLKAGDPSNLNTVVTLADKTLAAGKIYTVMLTGTLAGSGESALKLTLVTNN